MSSDINTPTNNQESEEQVAKNNKEAIDDKSNANEAKDKNENETRKIVPKSRESVVLNRRGR